jgi:Na+/melibiose symporter-like transporter
MPPIIALIVALFLIAKYPLTEKCMTEVRAELEQRRGKTVDT